MPHSIRAKLSSLRHKGMLEDKDYKRLCHALDLEKAEQNPCNDAISRDFQIGDEVRIIGSDPIYDDSDVGWVIRNASERVKTMYVMRNDGSADEEGKADWYRTGRHNAVLAEVIKALPSVTSSRHKGHWIDREEYDADRWKCSECGQTEQYQENFCPNCGADMRSQKGKGELYEGEFGEMESEE